MKLDISGGSYERKTLDSPLRTLVNPLRRRGGRGFDAGPGGAGVVIWPLG